MINDPYRRDLGAFVLGQLPPEEETAVRAHVDGCPECRAEVAELRPVALRLRDVDPGRLDHEIPVPPLLGELVLERVRGERRRVPRWAVLGAAAALIAVVAGGLGWYLGKPSIPLEPVPLAQTAPGVQADAALVPHTWGVEIKLTASGLAPGESYRVMISDRRGRDVSAGSFVGTGSARMRCNLNSSVLREDATGFTVLDPAGNVVLFARFP
ncbi:hypothetical protein FHS29_007061 [Saccharothrix tamanrassetensis]|uniref:Putative zinc-finger domain-containing protein n=1 Tax=Saccharothrix tamanrassetensis TaxID=1051531 RepID=A0A841CWR2_9PSEU|nr:zf-HC2 domain-containing protein [Saccharothrix tamanrassetensis]MBB5960437.1 hypothetical protein [Saccharothrix tamanrassetensis]